MTRARNAAVIATLLILAFGLGCASGYFVLYWQTVARRMNSDGRFAQLALALNNYYNDYGDFPPLVWKSKEDGPSHSWRVALLPYLDGQSVCDEYDSHQVWNSGQNLRLARRFTNETPGYFISPLAEDRTPGTTNYVGVDAVTMQWPRTANHNTRRARMITRENEFFIIVEVPDSDIHWMEPRDTIVTILGLESRSTIKN